ncbi:MAG: ABC-type transport auxiliary lipoprotein family protein [Ferrovibrionaceae bacterium]
MTQSFSTRRALLGRGLALGAAAPVLGACEAIRLGGPPPDLFTLAPKYRFDPNLPKVDWQLVIEEPLSSGALDTNRIAVRPSQFELKYWADARWTERAPRMVQTVLIESFENTGKIVAVGRQAVGLRSDYNLKSELREFELDLYRNPNQPQARVRLNLKLVRQPREQIIASASFRNAEPARSLNLPDVIEAFNEAINKFLRRTVEWTLQAPTHPGVETLDDQNG